MESSIQTTNVQECQIKKDILDNFIKTRTVQNCAQRSEQWYTMRQHSFGGSEISGLMNNCKKNYKSQKQFLFEKMQKMNGTQDTPFPQMAQLICDWGTFFEPVHREVIQDIFKCDVIETSMSQGTNLLAGCHQSPDGLSVINTKTFSENVHIKDFANSGIFDSEYITVLWEQKSPAYREPKIGEIPDHYIGQIKLGLALFDICDVGCYSDSVFKICSFRQMFSSGYNQQIIRKRTSMVKSEKVDPVYIGYIEIAQSSSQKLGFQLGDISSKLTDTTFNAIMEQIRLGCFQVKHHVFQFDGSEQQYANIQSELKSLGKTNSYICWKLVNLNFTAVEKSYGFSSILSIFVSIGKKILSQYELTKQIPHKEIQELVQFSKLIIKLKMPLTPNNLEDSWFLQHQKQIIEQFETIFQDDWQSFYVLLSLLLNSNDKEFIEKAHKYAKDASDLCRVDEQKNKFLTSILREFGNTFEYINTQQNHQNHQINQNHQNHQINQQSETDQK